MAAFKGTIITTNTAGRYMQEILKGKTAQGKHHSKEELQNLRDALTTYAEGLKPAYKTKKLALIQARATELGLNQAVDEAYDISNKCAIQGNALYALKRKAEEMLDAVDAAQKGHNELHEMADDHTDGLQKHRRESADIAKRTCTAASSSEQQSLEDEKELETKQKELDDASAIVQWYKKELKSHKKKYKKLVEAIHPEKDDGNDDKEEKAQMQRELEKLKTKELHLEAQLDEMRDKLDEEQQKRLDDWVSSHTIIEKLQSALEQQGEKIAGFYNARASKTRADTSDSDVCSDSDTSDYVKTPGPDIQDVTGAENAIEDGVE